MELFRFWRRDTVLVCYFGEEKSNQAHHLKVLFLPIKGKIVKMRKKMRYFFLWEVDVSIGRRTTMKFCVYDFFSLISIFLLFVHLIPPLPPTKKKTHLPEVVHPDYHSLYVLTSMKPNIYHVIRLVGRFLMESKKSIDTSGKEVSTIWKRQKSWNCVTG